MNPSDAISISAVNLAVLSVILSAALAYSQYVWSRTRERQAGVIEEANSINDLSVPTFILTGDHDLYDASETTTREILLERLRQILKGYPADRIVSVPGASSPSLGDGSGRGEEAQRVLLSIFSCGLFPRAPIGEEVSTSVELVRFKDTDAVRDWLADVKPLLRTLSFTVAMHSKDLEDAITAFDIDWRAKNTPFMIPGALEMVKPLAVVDGLVSMLRAGVLAMNSVGKALAMSEAYTSAIALPKRSVRAVVVAGAIVLLAGVVYPLVTNYPCPEVAVVVPVVIYATGFLAVASRLW